MIALDLCLETPEANYTKGNLVLLRIKLLARILLKIIVMDGSKKAMSNLK